MRADDRNGYIALVICAVAVFILITGAITGLILGEYAKVHQTNAAYQQNGERDRDAASQEISKACFDADFAVFSKCISEKVASYYKQQATNQDLQAQQDMAFWAAALFMLGIAQVVLSGVGIFFIWRSLRLNRDAVTAAVESNTVTREIGEAQVRAYLTCKEGTYTINPFGIGIRIESIILNSGQSPAVQIKVTASLIVLDNPPKQGKTAVNDLNRFGPKVFSGLVLSAGNSKPVNLNWTSDEIDEALISAVKFGTSIFLVEANINWSDVFQGTGSASYIMVPEARTGTTAAPQDTGALAAHNHAATFTRSKAPDPTKQN